jgi:hypothetical protein
VGENSGEFSPTHLRSSIQASLPGRAEGHFSAELGTARVSEPAYQTPKYLEFAAEMRIAEMSQATKHALNVYRRWDRMDNSLLSFLFGVSNEIPDITRGSGMVQRIRFI